MPEQRGSDSKGTYIRWGNRGTKHYYTPNNERSLSAAKKLVDKDRKRIEAFANR